MAAVKNMQCGKLRRIESNASRCKSGKMAAMKGLKVQTGLKMGMNEPLFQQISDGKLKDTAKSGKNLLLGNSVSWEMRLKELSERIRTMNPDSL